MSLNAITSGNENPTPRADLARKSLRQVLQEAETPALEQAEDAEYRLVGNSCWITANGFVVHIWKGGGGVAVEIYDDKPGEFCHILSGASAYPK